MTVLQAQGLGQSFGEVDLFAGVTVSVAPDARIGLVGPNGVGKTTLLRILAGQMSASAGRFDLARGARIGYLTQESAHAFGAGQRDIQAEMLSVFEPLRAEEARLAELEASISRGEGGDEAVERYGDLQARFELAGGYDYPIRIRRTLTGLGFEESSWGQPVAQLSGGQKTRLQLARLLLESPDLLILDEPTNHLDIEAVEWLEGTLGGWPGALLVVSHDRYFLDRVANTIWEMFGGGIETYRGNYSAYVGQRAERWALRQRAYEEMKAHFEKELDYIRRNIAGQRTQQAKGKLSRLSREVEAVHAGGLAVLDQIRSKGWLQATAGLDMERPSDRPNEVARRIGELRPPSGGPPRFNLHFAGGPRGGDFVLRSRDLVVGYEGQALLSLDDIELERGERAALIGGNGTGKTTFLRTLLGQLPPVAGELRLGGGQVIGYFSQAHENLDPGLTVLESIVAESGLQGGEARSYLGRFLFSGDEVDKRVATLSGGERGRLALAILVRRGANLLLLDEPTNHLDIPAQEMLEAALEAFEGTVILVSHDRYLVQRLASQIWAVEDGRLRIHPWGYAEYLAARQAGADRDGAGATSRSGDGAARGSSRGEDRKEASASAGSEGSTANGTPDDAPPALSKNEILRREIESTAIESRIAQLEGRLAELEETLQEAGEEGDYAAIGRLGEAHAALQAEIDGLLERWEALAAEIG
ncbi:MAG: ABC-F family ATP-binding cassette domain-containing protein [Caldilineae bacterium]|nr:ABC-F family ATP-binding cassette domain-containing protein [Chloroflexota bacterium]MCB9176856.1 ABC-F family ATP-binding cassette domain-containing protein [Caldilineae bacterium]